MGINEELELTNQENLTDDIDATKEVLEETSDVNEELEAVEDVEPILEDLESLEVETPVEETAEEMQAETEITPTKKKRLLNTPIIIAICVLAAAIVGLIVCLFVFGNGVTGTYEMTGSDGYTYYYTFAKDNKVTMNFGTISFVGEYENQISEESGEKTIFVNQYYGELYGSYTYEISGNNFFGTKTIVLTPTEDTSQMTGNTEPITLTKAKAPTPKDLLKKPENFTTDEQIIGDWEYNFEDYGVKYVFTFKNDGTMQINQYDSIIYDCVYTVDSNKVVCTFYTSEETSQELEYTCDGETLNIMGLSCHRVGAETVNEVPVIQKDNQVQDTEAQVQETEVQVNE